LLKKKERRRRRFLLTTRHNTTQNTLNRERREQHNSAHTNKTPNAVATTVSPLSFFDFVSFIIVVIVERGELYMFSFFFQHNKEAKRGEKERERVQHNSLNTTER
jgi:hypothetical protein